MALTIPLSQTSVAGALAALHAACFVTPRPWNAAEIGAFLADPAVFCVTEAAICGRAELLDLDAPPWPSRPIGFAIGRVVAGEAELLTLAVEEAARRGGTGRRLIAAYHAAAFGRGARRSVLEVARDNAPAQALYLGTGYRDAGRRRGYYLTPAGRRIDALVMDRPLAP